MSKVKFSALIADDHSLYRMGLRFLLQDNFSCSQVIETSSFDEAAAEIAKAKDLRLAIFDLSMPGMSGLENLLQIREQNPSLAIVVVTASEDSQMILRAMSLGLNGYVPKSLSEREFVAAIRMVLDGGIFVPRLLIKSAPARASRPPEKRTVSGGYQVMPGGSTREPTADAAHTGSRFSLTARQRDVLGCLAGGLSNKEIAHRLEIAEGTVKIHLAALFSHFGARNRVDLVARAGHFVHV